MDSVGQTFQCGKPVAWGNYYPCRQGGGSCPGSSSCFGPKCNYIERMSSNIYDGGYPPYPTQPTAMPKQGCQSNYAWCMGQTPQTCARVAPMTNVWGEETYMNKNGRFWAYNKGYDVTMPTWVGDGVKKDQYPVANCASVPSLVHYTAL